MIHQKVSSSAFSHIGYEPVGGRLDVRFHNGTTRRFVGVPPEVYRQFMGASSKGRFYHQHILPRFR